MADALRYRQLRGVAWPPSNSPPAGTGTAPDSRLSLEHVHGYRGSDCRDNVFFTRHGELLYFVAAVAIVENIDSGKQRFFLEHDDDIVSLALHPDGNIVATGQIGRNGAVCIWEADSSRLLCRLSKLGERRVNCLSFSGDGARLVAVGGDDHHTVRVIDWRRHNTPVIAEARGHGSDILAVRFNPHDELREGPQIVQCGAKHLKFWSLAKGGVLQAVAPSCAGKQGGPKAKLNQHFLCIDFYQDGSALVGAASGDVLHFRGALLASVLEGAHKGFVSAVRVMPDGDSICTSGKDGRFVVWGRSPSERGGAGSIDSLVPVLEIDLAAVLGAGGRKSVYGRGLAVNSSGDVLAIGSSYNDVVLFDRRSGALVTRILVRGHSGDVSGLAVDPTSPSFATVADDKTLRIWCTRRHTLLAMAELPAPGRAVAISAHGDTIAVGLASGGIVVFDPDSLQVLHHTPQCAREAIADLKFSPDGELLALASHDNCVYIRARST